MVNAGTDGTVCANNAAIALNGSVTGATGGTWSGGSGTFSPNANTLNASYAQRCGARGGQCNPHADLCWQRHLQRGERPGHLDHHPAPTANAGWTGCCAPTTQRRCSRLLHRGLRCGVEGGAGTFDPSTTNMGPSTPAAEIAASGTLTLTTTGNGLCNAATDQVLLTHRCAHRQCWT